MGSPKRDATGSLPRVEGPRQRRPAGHVGGEVPPRMRRSRQGRPVGCLDEGVPPTMQRPRQQRPVERVGEQVPLPDRQTSLCNRSDLEWAWLYGDLHGRVHFTRTDRHRRESAACVLLSSVGPVLDSVPRLCGRDVAPARIDSTARRAEGAAKRLKRVVEVRPVAQLAEQRSPKP